MTTPLFLLRCTEIGISIVDLDFLTIGLVIDMWTERANDSVKYKRLDPEWRDFWRNTYSSVIPAYHQNKEHWNSIILDGTIPDTDIKRMIAESYDLICKKK